MISLQAMLAMCCRIWPFQQLDSARMFEPAAYTVKYVCSGRTRPMFDTMLRDWLCGCGPSCMGRFGYPWRFVQNLVELANAESFNCKRHESNCSDHEHCSVSTRCGPRAHSSSSDTHQLMTNTKARLQSCVAFLPDPLLPSLFQSHTVLITWRHIF
jgi:hypothetical protein